MKNTELTAQIININEYGKVKIGFTLDILVPPNYELFDQNTLKIDILAGEDSD